MTPTAEATYSSVKNSITTVPH